MFTLTFPGEGVHDYDEAYRLVSEWLHYYGRQWFPAYITVPELHPGGHGWHWHLLHRHRPNKAQLREIRLSWSSFLAGKGYANTGVRIHAKHFASPRKAADYASKYVGKALGEVPAGRWRYLRSRVLLPPIITETVVRCLADVADYWRGLGFYVWEGQVGTGMPIVYAAPT